MLEFTKAAEARQAQDDESDEDVVEVNLWGLKVKAQRPTAIQAAVFFGSGARPVGEQANLVLGMIEAMMGTRARSHVQNLIMSNAIEMSDLIGGNERNENGVIEAVLQEFAGRPTQPSTDSAPSRPVGGRRSTGRSPGKGSIRSTSPSTASSTSSTPGPSSD